MNLCNVHAISQGKRGNGMTLRDGHSLGRAY
jgi:hypothetical protein